MNRSGSAPFDELRSRRDVEALEASLAASQARATASEARAAAAEAKVSDAQAQIAALILMIEKLRRAPYGRRSQRTKRLVGQLELELDELSARATEDDLAVSRPRTRVAATFRICGGERHRRITVSSHRIHEFGNTILQSRSPCLVESKEPGHVTRNVVK